MILPFKVIVLAFVVAEKLRPIVDTPSAKLILSTILTSPAPLFVNDTAPVKLFAGFVNVMDAAPVLKLDVPKTEIAPDCVIAPVAVIVRAPTF